MKSTSIHIKWLGCKFIKVWAFGREYPKDRTGEGIVLKPIGRMWDLGPIRIWTEPRT